MYGVSMRFKLILVSIVLLVFLWGFGYVTLIKHRPGLFVSCIVVSVAALVWAMYTDVADYGELKFGRRTTALVFSGAMFSQKMGWVVGGVISLIGA